MTVQTQTPARHATRLTLALAAIAGLILATFYVASPVFADHTGPLVDPDVTSYPNPGDNPNCTDVLGADGFDEEQKFDPPDTGTQGHVSWNSDGSFEAADGWLVAVAIVKGGNEGAAVYDYTGFPGGGVDHDNGLETPTGQETSHVTLCLVQGPEESEAPSVPASVEGSVAASVSASVPASAEGSVAGGTGTPAASLANTALSLTGSGSLATIFFGAVLIASLGALAYANVTAVRRRR